MGRTVDPCPGPKAHRSLSHPPVVVTVPDRDTRLKAEVHWSGGENTLVEVPKGKSGIHRYVSDPEPIELIRQLAH